MAMKIETAIELFCEGQNNNFELASITPPMIETKECVQCAYICPLHVKDIDIAPAAAFIDGNNENVNEGVQIQMECIDIKEPTNSVEGRAARQCQMNGCDAISSHQCSECKKYFCGMHSVEITPVIGAGLYPQDNANLNLKYHRCENCEKNLNEEEETGSLARDLFCILVFVIMMLLCALTAVYGEYLSSD